MRFRYRVSIRRVIATRLHLLQASLLAIALVTLTAHVARAATTGLQTDRRYDVVIRGGLVIDGTGQRGVSTDLVIDRGRIAFMGTVPKTIKATHTIDARGKVVTPGFIDAHAHTPPHALAHHALSMGVTSIVVGQDGRSPTKMHMRSWISARKGRRYHVNVIPLVGHASSRALARVNSHKPLGDRAIERLKKVIDEQMKAGAFGLSTALEYTPGRFASQRELNAVAKVVAANDGLIMSHLRSEDDDKIDAAIGELIEQGQTSGAPVHIAHFKVVYGKGIKRAEELLSRLEAVRKTGLRITADIYPYTASYTTTAIVFPAFAKPPFKYRQVKKHKRAELAAFLRKRVKRRGGPEAMLFGTGKWRGKTLAQIARRAGRPFEDVLIDDVGPYGASAAHFVMDEKLQDRLLMSDHVMIGSDGSGSTHHPRGHGTFARVIEHYVVKKGTLRLPQAIYKMTGLPAKTLGLKSRGVLKVGSMADVLVFDPGAVRERATFSSPQRRSVGMHWVFIAGQAVVKKGRIMKRRAGRLLLKK